MTLTDTGRGRNETTNQLYFNDIILAKPLILRAGRVPADSRYVTLWLMRPMATAVLFPVNNLVIATDIMAYLGENQLEFNSRLKVVGRHANLKVN